MVRNEEKGVSDITEIVTIRMFFLRFNSSQRLKPEHGFKLRRTLYFSSLKTKEKNINKT